MLCGLLAAVAGVPVVSTDVGSVSEIVLDEVTGKLARDLPGLIEGIRWVKSSITKSVDLGSESRKHALANFTTKKVASGHLELYKEVLDKVGR